MRDSADERPALDALARATRIADLVGEARLDAGVLLSVRAYIARLEHELAAARAGAAIATSELQEQAR